LGKDGVNKYLALIEQLKQRQFYEGRDKVEIKIENIGPSEAKAILLGNKRNRTRRAVYAAMLAREMSESRWTFDGAPIRISEEGLLLDGQHRMEAVVLSKATLPFVVVRGLSAESQDVMDTGAKRTVADVLSMDGLSNSALVAAIARLSIFWDSGVRSPSLGKGRPISSQQILVAVRSDDTYRLAATKMSGWYLGPASVRGFCWRLFSRRDPDMAEEFFRMFRRGSDLSEGHPVLALRERVIHEMSQLGYQPPGYHTALIIRAWNALRRGEKLIKIQAWRSSEEPRIPEPL
jgi:hypothetical protein